MGALRTSFLLTIIGFAAVASPFATQSGTNPDDQVRLFAVCTGRLSAMMEYQWMIDGPASERTKEMRDEMVSLLLATAQPGQEAVLMEWRINAKAAQAALLSQGAFPKDKTAGQRAMRRADRLLADCVQFILPQS